jgi:hypothetical protein
MTVSRIFIFAGVILVAIGLLIGVGLGRLPGDIYIKKENFTFYFPIVSCLVVSAVITVMFLIFRR